MDNKKSYEGSCFCGAVKLKVRGDPAGMGYCHCDSCRQYSYALWLINDD
jgi:hypothetical protein